MKYAIISDIHANLEALTSVMEDARSRGVDHFVCLGDIVGYNANPGECIDIVRELGCQVIMGNHDFYTILEEVPQIVNDRAKLSIEWTKKNISAEHMEWLSNLPLERRVGNFEIVHASKNDPTEWNYVINSIDAILHFHFQETPLCFFGHTHAPMYFSSNERKTHAPIDRLELEPDVQYMVNVGSVGQPRGDDKRAQYVIYDTRARAIEYHRVEYDVATACEKIRAAGLPEHNALRLEKSDQEAAAAWKLIASVQKLIDTK